MIKNREQFFTTNEAANVVGVSPDHIRRLISQGKIKAEKLGNCWLIKTKDLKIKRQRFPRNKEA